MPTTAAVAVTSPMKTVLPDNEVIGGSISVKSSQEKVITDSITIIPTNRLNNLLLFVPVLIRKGILFIILFMIFCLESDLGSNCKHS